MVNRLTVGIFRIEVGNLRCGQAVSGSCPVTRQHRSQGMTMIELLVTMLILMVGLMGALGLQTKMKQSDFESYQRTQALIILQDMVSKISINRYSAECYGFTLDTEMGQPYLGAQQGGGYLGTVTCSGYGNAETQALAVNDMNEWDSILLGTSEYNLDGEAVGGILDARGCISLDTSTNPQTYTVTVVWQGIDDTIAPSVNCGKNLYGDEKKRRAVSTTLQFASLI